MKGNPKTSPQTQDQDRKSKKRGKWATSDQSVSRQSSLSRYANWTSRSNVEHILEARDSSSWRSNKMYLGSGGIFTQSERDTISCRVRLWRPIHSTTRMRSTLRVKNDHQFQAFPGLRSNQKWQERTVEFSVGAGSYPVALALWRAALQYISIEFAIRHKAVGDWRWSCLQAHRHLVVADATNRRRGYGHEWP